MNFLAGPTPDNGGDIDWATDVIQGICRPGCNSDIWIQNGGTWTTIINTLSENNPYIQVPPAKPGSVVLTSTGEWINTTIIATAFMVKAGGTMEDAGTFRAENDDGHFYWKLIRTWNKCESINPQQKNSSQWVDCPLETVVGADGQRMIDDNSRSFSLCRWVRSPLAYGALTLFENNPSANPEVGWDSISNPVRPLAVSQTTTNAEQVAAGDDVIVSQPPPPMSQPPTSY